VQGHCTVLPVDIFRYLTCFFMQKAPLSGGESKGFSVCVENYGLSVLVCNVHLSVWVAAVGGYDSEGVVKKFVEFMTEVEAESSEIVGYLV